MSSTSGRDWRHMMPGEFGRPTKPKQDALFLVDESDACGTDALDGLGYGAVLWADRSDDDPTEEHPPPQ
ncbi:hypothetical protein [Streptomyces sp. NPDC091217]|uniref:hypothetical protein n=1 Tax=Streptomyces sp. NPDC091217 TaxID=3365975 RepID=UPI00382D11FB